MTHFDGFYHSLATESNDELLFSGEKKVAEDLGISQSEVRRAYSALSQNLVQQGSQVESKLKASRSEISRRYEEVCYQLSQRRIPITPTLYRLSSKLEAVNQIIDVTPLSIGVQFLIRSKGFKRLVNAVLSRFHYIDGQATLTFDDMLSNKGKMFINDVRGGYGGLNQRKGKIWLMPLGIGLDRYEEEIKKKNDPNRHKETIQKILSFRQTAGVSNESTGSPTDQELVQAIYQGNIRRALHLISFKDADVSHNHGEPLKMAVNLAMRELKKKANGSASDNYDAAIELVKFLLKQGAHAKRNDIEDQLDKLIYYENDPEFEQQVVSALVAGEFAETD